MLLCAPNRAVRDSRGKRGCGASADVLLCGQAVMFRLRWRSTPRPWYFGPGCMRRIVVLGLPTSGARRTFGAAASPQCALETHIKIFAASRDDMRFLPEPPAEPPGLRTVALELKRPGRAAVVITARPGADNISMVALRRSDQAEGEVVPLQLLEPALLDLAFPPLEPATATGPAVLDPAGCRWSRVVMRVFRFLRDNKAIAGESGRDFCCRVVDGVGLAACGFRFPAEVRTRLVDTELWGLVKAAEGSELPTAEWWAAWCFGDMQHCRPIGRPLPAHAVLASLLQLAGEMQVSDMSETSTRVKLFAERAVAVKRADTKRAAAVLKQRGHGAATARPARENKENQVVKELFVETAHPVPPVTSDSEIDLCFAARSVAIEAVQDKGGRYLHRGIAWQPKTEGRPFEAVRDRFMEVGRVAAKRHGTQDMGVAGPNNAPGVCLATMASTSRCCHVPLTIRETDYDVAETAACLWLSGTGDVSGEKLPLCATFASQGQGKTVQLLLTIGLLVEARGGAGLFATANSDQQGPVNDVIQCHKDVWGRIPTAGLAMAVAVFHRACVALVSSAKAASMVDTLLEKKVLLSHSVNLKTALSVARALVGCRPADPLFVAVDEVAKFAGPLFGVSNADDKNEVMFNRAAALKTITAAAGRKDKKIVPIMGALDCFDLVKLATHSSARSVLLMPLSPLIPMDADLAHFLPPIARAVCLEREAFKNSSQAVRKALGRVGALLMSTGGHGRVLNSALEKLQVITEEQVCLLKCEDATKQEKVQVLKDLTAACDKGDTAVADATTCDLYECASFRHPRLTPKPLEVFEKSEDEAEYVLLHLTTPFQLPNLNSDRLNDCDPTRVLRRHLVGAWEFAAVPGRPTSLKLHPPPVALPAVLSRFLVDATPAAGPALQRLKALFDLVLMMNLIVMIYARDATGGGVLPGEENRRRAVLFELASGRVITIVLMLPTGEQPKKQLWLAKHTQLCSGAHTVDPLHGVMPSPVRYTNRELRELYANPSLTDLVKGERKEGEKAQAHEISFPLNMKEPDLTLHSTEALKPLATQIREHVLTGPGQRPGVLHFRPSRHNNALCDFVHVVRRPPGPGEETPAAAVDVLLWGARSHFNTDGCLEDVIGFKSAAAANEARSKSATEINANLQQAQQDFLAARELPPGKKELTDEQHSDQRRLSRQAAYLQLPELERRLSAALADGGRGPAAVRVILSVVSQTASGKPLSLPPDCRVLSLDDIVGLCPAVGLPLRAAATYNGQLLKPADEGDAAKAEQEIGTSLV